MQRELLRDASAARGQATPSRREARSKSPAPTVAVAKASETEVAQRLSERLLADLKKAQGVSEVEGRLLASITELFEELAGEERRRRSVWEEKAERELRGIRNSLDTELASGACETRRLVAEARREATEARRFAQPCHDLLAAFENQEAPPGITQLLKREAQTAATAESERILQALRQELKDATAAAFQESTQDFARMVKEEGERWAKACAGQLASALLVEQQAREEAKAELERRATEVEEALAGTEARLGPKLRELQTAHSSLVETLARYGDRWEAAWKEEAEARATGDAEAHAEAARRAEVLLQASGAQAQIEANARQDSFTRLRKAMEDVQMEIREEAKARTTADAILTVSIEELRSLAGNIFALFEGSPGQPGSSSRPRMIPPAYTDTDCSQYRGK